MEQNEKSGKLLEVKDLRVSFFTPAGEVKAVSGISYDLDYDEVMGIVGESGSGKSQEAYSIMGLLQSPGKVIGGSITFEGRDVLAFSKKEMASFRGSEVAMIFQNPMTCLNPVYTVGNQLIEALRAHDKKISKADAAKRAMEMLELVGLKGYERRNTAALSGGQQLIAHGDHIREIQIINLATAVVAASPCAVQSAAQIDHRRIGVRFQIIPHLKSKVILPHGHLQ